MSKSYGTISAKRKITKPSGFLHNTSKAGLALDVLGIGLSLFGGPITDFFTNPTEIGEENLDEIDAYHKSEEEKKKEKEKEKVEISEDPYDKNGGEIKVLVDPREMKSGVSNFATGAANSERVTAGDKSTTVNQEILNLLSGANLTDDDHDINTVYLYDLYFVTDMKDRTLKRYPTIRNYQNAYSFASMLKEKGEEQTFEEIVMICFYFRMI